MRVRKIGTFSATGIAVIGALAIGGVASAASDYPPNETTPTTVVDYPPNETTPTTIVDPPEETTPTTVVDPSTPTSVPRDTNAVEVLPPTVDDPGTPAPQAPADTPSATVAAGVLPSTGGDSGGTAKIAGGVALAGLGLVAVGRRRRTSATS